MRQAILDQLKKCQWADLSNFNYETGSGVIPKYTKPHFELNKCYLVKIPDEWVDNSNSIVATNWNAGSSPKYAYLKIFITKLLGKMVYVESLAFDYVTHADLNYMWSGWLNSDNLTMLTVL